MGILQRSKYVLRIETTQIRCPRCGKDIWLRKDNCIPKHRAPGWSLGTEPTPPLCDASDAMVKVDGV